MKVSHNLKYNSNGLPSWHSGKKNLPIIAGNARDVRLITGLENGNPLQYSHLENSMGKRSLEGYSPWGHKETDMTEHT